MMLFYYFICCQEEIPIQGPYRVLYIYFAKVLCFGGNGVCKLSFHGSGSEPFLLPCGCVLALEAIKQSYALSTFDLY